MMMDMMLVGRQRRCENGGGAPPSTNQEVTPALLGRMNIDLLHICN